jgi:hypothetical protein
MSLAMGAYVSKIDAWYLRESLHNKTCTMADGCALHITFYHENPMATDKVHTQQWLFQMPRPMHFEGGVLLETHRVRTLKRERQAQK